METVETLVIGAGVVGLAVARILALAGHEVVIAEAAEAFGTETSARNSEVIHAGIYYAKDSLKARLCVAGREALYRYCAERGVTARRVGKLIVATDPGQEPELRQLQARAAANGVTDLRWLSATEAQALEPQLACTAALLSPSTGIIDSHGLMLACLGEAEDHGAMLALHAPVQAGHVEADGMVLEFGGPAPMKLKARHVVNAAGLQAQAVANRIRGLRPGSVPPCHYAKGNYFVLSGIRAPFTRLIYPVPEPGGLGTHVTLDLAGQMRFGPDVEWIERIDYSVDPARGDRFYSAVRRYWPGLPDGAIQPGYAGIRPKLSRPGHGASGGAADDFMVQGRAAHGVRGLINLFGIESPGLTASLALADHVAALLKADMA